MVSLLEGKLKKIVAQKFKGRLLKGELVVEGGTTVDNYGDVIQADSATYTFEGIRESFSALYLAQAGIPDTDVKILFILGSIKLNGSIVDIQPHQGNKVFIGQPARWHQVRRILEIDPAGASMTVQATEI